MVINKFRGDETLLKPGITMLEEQLERAVGKANPVVGVIPYMSVRLEDEDSLTKRFDRRGVEAVDLAVVRYPRISNFTDFDVFEQAEGVSLRYVQSVEELGEPDMIFLPGSKNTIGDLKWMRENGLEAALKKLSRRVPVFGICGGFQMLGERICDPYGVENQSGAETQTDTAQTGGQGQKESRQRQIVQSDIRGMELLPVTTMLRPEKTRRVVQTAFCDMHGVLACLNGLPIEGYEIHMGETAGESNSPTVVQNENIYGTYLHGIFDGAGVAAAIVNMLAEKKGVSVGTEKMLNYRDYKETQYDLLAETLREHLDMQAVYHMLREARLQS